MLTFEESTCASTAVIAVGNVVAFDSDVASNSHRIVRASSAANGTPILTSVLLGVAAKGSTSDGSTLGLGSPGRTIDVWMADPGTEFLFPTKVVLASSHIGAAMELTWDSTSGVSYVGNNSTAGDARVLIQGIGPMSAVGDTGGYLIGRFQSTAVSAAFSVS